MPQASSGLGSADSFGKVQLEESSEESTLLTLLKRGYRVPYKVNRSGQYWKEEQLSRTGRIERLLDQFRDIKGSSILISTTSRDSSPSLRR